MGRLGLLRILTCELATGMTSWWTPASESAALSYALPALTGAVLVATLAWRCSQRVAHSYPAVFEV